MPIGFIYVQLPRRSSPHSLWPLVTWEDVTYNYAGLFFRAEGGNSASFGSNQASDSPRLSQVQFYDDPDTGIVGVTSMQLGGWSSPVRSGTYVSSSQDKVALRFLVSSGETRPTNTAVRIYMRTR